MYRLICKSSQLKDLSFETESNQLSYVKRPIPLSSILHEDLIFACAMIETSFKIDSLSLKKATYYFVYENMRLTLIFAKDLTIMEQDMTIKTLYPTIAKITIKRQVVDKHHQ